MPNPWRQRPLYYTLDPVTHMAMPCDGVLEWARWFEKADRTVAYDSIEGVGVSTVFLGLDRGFSADPDALPVLFETMVFLPEDGGEGSDMERYCAWHDAIAGHRRMVAAVHKLVDESHAISRAALERIYKTNKA